MARGEPVRSVREGPDHEVSIPSALLRSLEFILKTGEEWLTELKQDVDMISKICRSMVRWQNPKSLC